MRGEEAAATRDDRLRATFESRLPVLPVLGSQLREAVLQMERGVVDVSVNFERMASRARQSVAAARTVVSGEGQTQGGGMQSAGALARQTLDRLLGRLSHSSRLSLEIGSQLEKLESSLEGITHILDDVDRMARGTRLLGLNAAIEASRFGAEGKAFGIVAKEIEEMARHSSRTSTGIREVLHGLTGDVGQLSAQIRSLASFDLTEAEASRREVDAAMDTLARAGQEMTVGLLTASEGADELARDIASAVMALQFQDSVTQRVTHVIDALDQMHRALSAASEGRPADTVRPGEDDALRALEASYTMSAERDAQARACGGVPGEAEAGSIELF